MQSPTTLILLVAFVIGFGTLGSNWGWFDNTASPLRGTPAFEVRSLHEATAVYTIAATYPEVQGFGNKEDRGLNDKLRSFIEDQIAIFKEDSAVPQELGFEKSNLSISPTVHRFDRELVSITFKNAYYISGAAHPGEYTLVFNYVPMSGIFVELPSLFTGKYLEVIREISRAELQNAFKVRGVDSYDIEKFNRGTEAFHENYQTFALSADTLFIYFDEYHIGPYALGSFVVPIPLQNLHAYIRSDGALSSNALSPHE